MEMERNICHVHPLQINVFSSMEDMSLYNKKTISHKYKNRNITATHVVKAFTA